jgi:hypothetical protein
MGGVEVADGRNVGGARHRLGAVGSVAGISAGQGVVCGGNYGLTSRMDSSVIEGFFIASLLRRGAGGASREGRAGTSWPERCIKDSRSGASEQVWMKLDLNIPVESAVCEGIHSTPPSAVSKPPLDGSRGAQRQLWVRPSTPSYADS